MPQHRQTDRQAGRQREGRRPGPSFRVLLFGTSEGAVCESWRLEDSQPQLHAGERAGDPLFLALARAPFVSLGGWKKGSFVSFGSWKKATVQKVTLRTASPALKPRKPFRNLPQAFPRQQLSQHMPQSCVSKAFKAAVCPLRSL